MSSSRKCDASIDIDLNSRKIQAVACDAAVGGRRDDNFKFFQVSERRKYYYASNFHLYLLHFLSPLSAELNNYHLLLMQRDT